MCITRFLRSLFVSSSVVDVEKSRVNTRGIPAFCKNVPTLPHADDATADPPPLPPLSSPSLTAALTAAVCRAARMKETSSSSSSSSFSCGALCVGRLIAREEKTLLRSHRIHQNSLGKWTPTPTPLDKIRLIRTTSNTTPGLNTVTAVMVTRRDTIRTTMPIARRDEEEEEAGINENT